MTTVAIVGAGIFGVTAALALRKRGHRVALLDPGPIPHPLAESTDISKVVRLDYGADEAYMAMMESALEGWQRWNASWGEPLYHDVGVTFLSRGPMEPGGFERDSYDMLLRRGHRPERVGPEDIRARFPAWNADELVDGYFNPEGGYAESGRVVAALAREAESLGVTVLAGQAFERLHERGGRVFGVVTREGVVEADRVVIAAGAWTGTLLPSLAPCLPTVGQPVFHLRPEDPLPYQAARFPVFGADIARTGYYGFSASAEGIVKIANHGVGRPMHPGAEAERVITAAEEARFREFLRITFPGLASAPIVYRRVCVYGDTLDGHFWIAPDPDREGLVVAAGGSGHAFKFAPILGDLVADAALGAPNPWLARFRWRPEVLAPEGQEAARHRG
jgi:sarcosine oxidase / L-pipecolate oxidase